MNDSFWDTHYTMAATARIMGCKRQNIHQRAKRGSIPSEVSPEGVIGIPMEYVMETLALRNRDVVGG